MYLHQYSVSSWNDCGAARPRPRNDVEFCGETGLTHEYHFDSPELMQGIAAMFRRAAVDAKLIRTGLATFAELANHWGGIAECEEDDDDKLLTYADFERFLAEQEDHDDD